MNPKSTISALGGKFAKQHGDICVCILQNSSSEFLLNVVSKELVYYLSLWGNKNSLLGLGMTHSRLPSSAMGE